MCLERLMNDAALNARAAAVNQPNLAQSRTPRGADIFLDDRSNVSGEECVEVETVFDRNVERAVVVGLAHGFS
jgi:hypothetical protein